MNRKRKGTKFRNSLFSIMTSPQNSKESNDPDKILDFQSEIDEGICCFYTEKRKRKSHKNVCSLFLVLRRIKKKELFGRTRCGKRTLLFFSSLIHR